MSKPEIILADSAGFCFGVERAVSRVYEEAAKGGSIYTYGPIIHNREVVADLEARGVHVVESEEEVRALRQESVSTSDGAGTLQQEGAVRPGGTAGTPRQRETRPGGTAGTPRQGTVDPGGKAGSPKQGTVIIRSHGVSRSIDRMLRESGLECIDATCPFVKRIHRTVEAESAAGKKIVIVGNPVHPEVMGIMGWSSTPVTVIQTAEEAENKGIPGVEPGTEVCVVAQTTFNANKFEVIVDILQKKYYNVLCVNTICNATHERQSEAESIAARADVMIVIGDRSSSNSAKLFEICRRKCPKTYFIQTWKDLHLTLTGAEKVIGITAGASTPKNIIEEVYNHVRADL